MLINKLTSNTTHFGFGIIVSVALLLSGCGGAGSGGGSKGGPASSYTIGGTISGLTGPVVLQNMGGDNLTVPADGKFVFNVPINNGNLYNVTVLTQPTGEVCSISSGSGIVSGNTVSNVAIFCSTNKYTVGGSVTGLTGTVVLQNNAGDNLTLTANGTYSFATQVAFNSPYTVSVLTQPSGNQTCSVANATGTMGASNVSNVNISCATSTYSVGVTVTGFNTNIGGTNKLVLQNNGGNDLNITTNGSFNFSTAITFNNPYSVTVKQQPALQACTVSATGAAGTVTGTVSNIAVSCGNLRGGGVQGNALAQLIDVKTLAGAPAGMDGTGAAARFSNPMGVVTDGTSVFVLDTYNNKIRKIDIATKVVTTFAGSVNNTVGAADGVGTAASFNAPMGITTDGTSLYVADTYNYKIRKIDIATATVTSVTGVSGVVATPPCCTYNYAIDGAAASAVFNTPQGIAYFGGNLYVADTYNYKIRKVDLAAATVSSLTGPANAPAALTYTCAPTCGYNLPEGPTAASAVFGAPQGITTDGTSLYVADTYGNKIRKITPSAGTLAAMTSANATVSSFTGTANTGVVMNYTCGGVPYTCIPPSPADGAAAGATFYNPTGITTDGVNLYVADTNSNKIRKIVIATATVSSMTGMMNWPEPVGNANGAGPATRFSYPRGITTDGINLYVADTNNNTIRAISISPVVSTTLAGNIAGADGIGAAASFSNPRGFTSDGTNLYMVDTYGHKIRKIVIATGEVTTLAGTGAVGAIDGSGSVASFNSPQGITTDGSRLYVTDTNNFKIRIIAPSSGTLAAMTVATSVVSTLTGPANAAGTSSWTCNPTCVQNNPLDGAAATAVFYAPQGITTDGTSLFVTDAVANKIRKIAPVAPATLATMTSANAVVSSLTSATDLPASSAAAACTLACDGTGTAATFNYPVDITTDGSNLYVADVYNYKVRKIAPPTGSTLSTMTNATAVVSSLTGPANAAAVLNWTCPTPTTCGYSIPDGPTAASAVFASPQGITTDGTSLYVSDTWSNKIRKIAPSNGTLAAVTSANAVVSSLTGASGVASTAGVADGTLSNASFNAPGPITTDGGALFVIDTGTSLIRKIQ